MNKAAATPQEQIKKAAATIAARKALKQMILQGLGEEKYIFALSRCISEAYSLTEDEAIEIMQKAFLSI